MAWDNYDDRRSEAMANDDTELDLGGDTFGERLDDSDEPDPMDTARADNQTDDDRNIIEKAGDKVREWTDDRK